MIRWKAIGTVIEGQEILVDGINPWEFEWQSADPVPIELPHTSYPNQMHSMHVYQVIAKGRTVLFAAGEVSANVWSFYVPVE